MSEPEPAAIHEHALSNLRYIRDAMERAGSFTSIPGWGGFVIGVTAIGATAIAQRYTADGATWLAIWLAEATLAGIIAAVTMWRKAARANVSLTSKAARRFFVSYFAPITAGALITFVLARAGAFSVLPALWLLLYGSTIISSGAFSIPVVTSMGVCFMLFGIAACLLDFSAGNILLGAGFGGLHIVFGLIIARSYGG